MKVGLKKDLRVFRVEILVSLNAFFSLLSHHRSFLPKICGRGKENKHTWRAQYNGELYAAFGKDESFPRKNLLILYSNRILL